MPLSDSVIFKPHHRAAPALQRLHAGDLDIGYDRHPQNLQDAIAKGVNTTSRVDNHGGYWMLNNVKEPFNIRSCRLAAAHAIDYDTVNEVVYDGLNNMVRSLMRPGSPWTDSEAVLPGYDTDAAAAALADCEAELGGPLEFSTYCTTSAENVLLTETLGCYVGGSGHRCHRQLR